MTGRSCCHQAAARPASGAYPSAATTSAATPAEKVTMARVDLNTLDGMRLVGDEDCGVGLDCRDCDRGGLPIAYYAHPDDRSFAGQEVVRVDSIAGLVMAAVTHRTSVHRDVPAAV